MCVCVRARARARMSLCARVNVCEKRGGGGGGDCGRKAGGEGVKNPPRKQEDSGINLFRQTKNGKISDSIS